MAIVEIPPITGEAVIRLEISMK